MSETNAFVSTEFALLLYWINERESIRKAKQEGRPKPWTQDSLLTDYRWCNVSRMDDRVSVDLMTRWYSDSNARTQLVAAALGRLINWPDALLDATEGKPFQLGDLARVRPALHARAARGEKVFTGAYVIPGVRGRNKIESIMDLVECVARAADDIFRPTLRQTWEALTQLDGLGSFLAGQIGADLAQLSSGNAWPDRFAWAPVGPGSARGMNRLRGRAKTLSIPQAQFDRELLEYINCIRPEIAAIDADRRLCAQDYQGTLCEFDKYRRLSLQEGKVRARYDGAGRAAADTQEELFQ